MTNANLQKHLSDMTTGETLSGYFILRSIELKTKRDGKPFLSLSIGDASARLPANLWDNAEHFYQQFQVGSVVKIDGKIGTYKDSPQVVIDRIRKATKTDNVHASDFMPKAPIDIDLAFKKLNKMLDTVKNPDLRRLMTLIFSNDDRIQAFKSAPGGKLWHHAYVGGLLEHTLNVSTVCMTMADMYPDIDRELLLCGAILHDIGKLEEYNFDGGFIDFTDAGRLMGHITLGAQMVQNLISELDDESPFDHEIKQLLIHLILAHQGKREHGSPVEPAIPEAMILYYADEMDSKVNALGRIKERDASPGRKWSQYIQLLGRYIYLREDRAEDTAQTAGPIDPMPPTSIPIPSEPPGDEEQATLFD
ncbi:HD domain-containing protein [bacterium]|nr:HD domain-containing protein [bacterium]